jgi:SAM-dependent methyltransferase
VTGYKFDYESKVWGGDIIRLSPIYFRASRLYWALKSLQAVKGKVLDVGCGVGDFPEAIQYYRPDLDIYAVDISNQAITLAKKRELNVDFRVADAQKLPYSNDFFDAVVCFDLIEHVRSPSKALKQIYRILKPGGVFHVFLPTEGNFFTLEGLFIKLGWRGKEIHGAHPHVFTTREALGIVNQGGFKVLKKRWGDHFIHQSVEIIHFSTLLLLKRNMHSTIEGYINIAKPSFTISIIKLIKNCVSSLSFIETMSLFWFPGLGLHLTCRKN